MNIEKIFSGWFSKLGNYALGRILPALVLLSLGMLVIHIVMRLIRTALERSNLERAAHTLIKSVTRTILTVLLILAVLSFLGIDITGVVALASVLTLAISLALQNALTNMIGGFQLLYNDPFSSGDYVEIAGQAGTVLEIGLTYTKLSTPDNKIISIPNNSVVSSEIVNYTVSGSRRVTLNITASYDSPVELVLSTLAEAGKVDTLLPEKEPFVALNTYGDSSIGYIMHLWCKTEDYWTTYYAVNKRIKVLFDEKGIEMTYPHLNVHLDK